MLVTTIRVIYLIGYTISAISLICSLVIFHYFRSLQRSRIRIHMHFFFAFLMNNLLWIVSFLVEENDLDNKVWCQVLHIIINYFMMAMYSWMFCEGIYIMISLALIFVNVDLIMTWFKIICWGLPFILVMIDTILFYNMPGAATDRCWVETTMSFWILTTPILASLFISFGFLIIAITIIITKLRVTCGNDTAATAIKAVRATLILIPMFGLHFLIFPLRPNTGTFSEPIYEVFYALITSLQGLFVSISFCFTTHDVKLVIRSLFDRGRRRNEVVAMTGVTGAAARE